MGPPHDEESVAQAESGEHGLEESEEDLEHMHEDRAMVEST